MTAALLACSWDDGGGHADVSLLDAVPTVPGSDAVSTETGFIDRNDDGVPERTTFVRTYRLEAGVNAAEMIRFYASNLDEGWEEVDRGGGCLNCETTGVSGVTYERSDGVTLTINLDNLQAREYSHTVSVPRHQE